MPGCCSRDVLHEFACGFFTDVEELVSPGRLLEISSELVQHIAPFVLRWHLCAHMRACALLLLRCTVIRPFAFEQVVFIWDFLSASISLVCRPYGYAVTDCLLCVRCALNDALCLASYWYAGFSILSEGT